MVVTGYYTLERQKTAIKMVYEWDGKRDECYRLYITENKSLEDIVELYRVQNFVPRYVVDSTISTVGACADFATSFHDQPLTTKPNLAPKKMFL